MIPKGNMMASTLNKVDAESYDLLEFRCSNKKETPEENKQLEEEIKLFLEKGISKISRQGDDLNMDRFWILMMLSVPYCCSEDSLEITAGSETKTVTLDLMLKRQEDAKRAAMTAANKNPRRR